MNKQINENMIVKDSLQDFKPVGIITIRRNGKIISQTHNMIVKSGRSIIAKLFGKYFHASSTDTNDYSNIKFFIKFSFLETDVQVITNSELTLEQIDKNTVSTTSAIFEISDSNTSYNDEDLTFTITTTLTNDGTNSSAYTKYNQIYIYYTNGTDTKLFSRAITEPTFIGADSSDSLEYKIHF